jgi:hypothetical protein
MKQQWSVLARGVTVTGVGVALIGSVLPWVRLPFFGIEVALPGVVGYGLLTATLAWWTMTLLGRPALWRLALGVGMVVIALYARVTLGEGVARQVLSVQRSLIEVNHRLSQVSLPPLEPFGSFRRRQEYVASGSVWTLWGGVLVVAGSVLGLRDGIQRRTCLQCRTRWDAARAETLSFCPMCGVSVRLPQACIGCGSPFHVNDKFCSICGKER